MSRGRASGGGVWGRCESPKTKKRLNFGSSAAWFYVLTVKDGNFRLRRNPHQRGLGLNADTHAKQRREFAGGFGDGDDGGAIIHADNMARLACVADTVASAETVRMIFHGGFFGCEKRRLRCLGKLAGAFCLGAFAGDAFTIKGVFLHQVERLRRESEFMLRDRQAASISFHGRG